MKGKTIKEGILDNIYSIILGESEEKERNVQNVSFFLDEMTVQTLLEDEQFYVLTESNNWILKQSSWEVNNYPRFLQIVKSTPADKKGFLTWHGMDEITGNDWRTYTLKGHDVCFALHYIDKGKVDICNLVNNSDLKGIGKYVLQFAKQEGGTQMDNYRGVDDQGNDVPGKLGTLYRQQGFDRQTDLYKFDPQYQPEDDEWKFDTEKYGTPDIEALERSKHRMKYNNPQRGYQKKFDDRMDQKFGVKK